MGLELSVPCTLDRLFPGTRLCRGAGAGVSHFTDRETVAESSSTPHSSFQPKDIQAKSGPTQCASPAVPMTAMHPLRVAV